jgi:hypothetical protein
MNTLLKTLAPGATDMIRADHGRVMTAFHRYSSGAAPGAKRALVSLICLALDVHAQIEEEIFYPAVRAAGSTLVDELAAEHARMRSLIAALEGVEPSSGQYDSLFMELMREVIHHVADEETRVLPEAERFLGPRLKELGARMARRRLELTAPRAGELVRMKARALPKAGVAAGAALAILAGAFVFRNSLKRTLR